MEFDPQTPFNELPPLPPNMEVESKAVLKKATSAGRALGELKGLGETIPNQDLLLNPLLLQEAKASSEIENVGLSDLGEFFIFVFFLNPFLSGFFNADGCAGEHAGI